MIDSRKRTLTFPFYVVKYIQYLKQVLILKFGRVEAQNSLVTPGRLASRRNGVKGYFAEVGRRQPPAGIMVKSPGTVT
jgi:hypothetical protein